MGFKGTEIPQYIKAGTPEGLRQLMFKNNARLGSFVNYFNIQYIQEPNQKPYWIVWYYIEVKDNDPMFSGKADK